MHYSTGCALLLPVLVVGYNFLLFSLRATSYIIGTIIDAISQYKLVHVAYIRFKLSTLKRAEATTTTTITTVPIENSPRQS